MAYVREGIMDAIKKLAERLQRHTNEEKPKKSPHTISVNHKDYMLLFAYCRRKGLVIGEVISDLMKMLITELISSGDLDASDQAQADKFQKSHDDRVEAKKIKTIHPPEDSLPAPASAPGQTETKTGDAEKKDPTTALDKKPA